MTPTKKAVRKVAVKKVGKSSKKVARPRAQVSAEVTTTPVSDVFTTREQRETTVEVPAGTVALLVNGRQKGTVATEGKTLKEFVTSAAQREGIRSFSVYVDNAKATTADGAKQMNQMHKVEIVSKDARG